MGQGVPQAIQAQLTPNFAQMPRREGTSTSRWFQMGFFQEANQGVDLTNK